MKCPRCGDGIHEMTTDEGVTVDFCSKCRGIFFDGGEVAVYFELRDDLPRGEASVTQAPLREALPCPRCAGAMAQVRYKRDPGLVVDRCGACGGMWLDAGEVPRMQKLSAQMEPAGGRLAIAFKRLDDAGYQILGVKR